jgi:hypothetical protein
LIIFILAHVSQVMFFLTLPFLLNHWLQKLFATLTHASMTIEKLSLYYHLNLLLIKTQRETNYISKLVLVILFHMPFSIKYFDRFHLFLTIVEIKLFSIFSQINLNQLMLSYLNLTQHCYTKQHHVPNHHEHLFNL